MAQTLAASKCQEREQEDGWRPLPVSDRRPGERAPLALVSIPPCAQGLGGLSRPPTQLCLHPASAPDRVTSYFLQESESLWHDPKDPDGSEEEGDPKSHRGGCGVCAYPQLLPKAQLSRLFPFL